jgi:hypothetical protein
MAAAGGDVISLDRRCAIKSDGDPIEEWLRIVRHGVEEGDRNNTAARLAGYLLPKGLDIRIVFETMRAWNEVRCRPPLPEAELENIVISISNKELARRKQ